MNDEDEWTKEVVKLTLKELSLNEGLINILKLLRINSNFFISYCAYLNYYLFYYYLVNRLEIERLCNSNYSDTEQLSVYSVYT